MSNQGTNVRDAVTARIRSAKRGGKNEDLLTNRIIVGRSRPIPQPWTCTSLGKPMGSNISGRNMPLLPTSTHFLSCGWKAKISNDGYGSL